MLVFNEEVGEKDCPFNITENTKQFIVGFFGFFPHSIHDRFVKFLKSLEVKDVAGQRGVDINLFSLNGDYAIEAYDMVDRRTFDTTTILPKIFNTEEEAKEWLHKKIKESDFILMSEILEIEVIDADKFIDSVNTIIELDSKEKLIKQRIKKRS
tara:strand:+ start:1428 stop:1889 length:462 start_codon:yes stop_codon:yes gene_type:complete